MDTIWVVLSTALLVFCLYAAYKVGYKAGARMVLKDWKQTLADMDMIIKSGDETNE